MASYYDEDQFVKRYAERFSLKIDKDWSFREARLYILQKFLNGSIYDNLQPFHREYTTTSNSGSYVPLAHRRPCIIYKIYKIIVDASVSMLFGEGHFPIPRCEHEDTTKFLQYVTRVCDLRGAMIDVARKGSVGSAVLLIKILDGKFYFEALHSIHLIPIFKRTNPHELESLSEKKKIDGASLRTQGYDISDDEIKESFFICREWTEEKEIYYKPYKIEKNDDPDFKPIEDKDRTTEHNLGFVPAVWIKNLPKTGGADGHCTFEDILDIGIEIDYQLSQHSRLLRYNSDPTLVVKNPGGLNGQEIIKGVGALELDEKGDAYLLEITTGATKSVMEFVKGLREIALEMVRGNRGNPDKIHSAQSGEALKMLNFELISLVEEMRLTYGEFGLLKAYCMILRMAKHENYQFEFNDYAPQPLDDCAEHITLDWPPWHVPSNMDKLNEAKTLSSLLKDGVISKKTAIETIADEYNILDVEEELREVEENEQELYDKETELESKQNPVDREPESVDRLKD